MPKFNFEISLSILNHLWRNLYRNFITVIWEAISNSWDADAKNIHIYVEENSLIILDDWTWMSEQEFQERFLNIWYSKRDELWDISKWKRPFIWRKGIWKLALLSCAERIHIATKKRWEKIVWWIIDNSELDEKIQKNLKTEQYPLGTLDETIFSKHPIASKIDHWTLIHFEELNDWIKSNLEVIRKLIVLNFRFSLIDPSFNIFVNNEPISLADIKDLSESTEFLWNINNFNDSDFFDTLANKLEEATLEIKWKNIFWFIASVEFPKFLNIYWTGEKTWVDLFVNWRLRENNILKNMSWFSTRHIASYLYWQIHLNDLDDKEDRFTSSREWVKPGDEKYGEYLETIEKVILNHISKEWDKWRKKHKKTWDIDNWDMPKFQALMHQSKDSREKDFEEKLDDIKIDDEIKDSLKEKMRHQSSNNTAVYQDLFILENLFREFIKIKWLSIEDIKKEAESNTEIKWCLESLELTQNRREAQEEVHELWWKIVKENHFLNFADFEYLWILVDFIRNAKHTRHKPQTMLWETKTITPVRNPIMHTNEISDDVIEWGKIHKLIDFVDKLADE